MIRKILGFLWPDPIYEVPQEDCCNCAGTGRIPLWHDNGEPITWQFNGQFEQAKADCPECNGKGVIE